MTETTASIITLLLAVIGSIASILAVWLAVRLISHAIWFSTKRAGAATPADVGLAYSEHWIRHGKRCLQAWFVKATPQQGVETAVLMFQGGNRVISELVDAQKYLYDHGVSSMVFDFGGNGNSTGMASRDAVRDDGVAAYRKLQTLVGSNARVFLCGFSRSAGRVLTAISESAVQADGVILFGANSTTRDVMLDHLKFIPRKIGALLFPLYWDNLTAIRNVRCPILLVHSTDDELVPFAQCQKLCEAASVPVRLAVVSGLKHDDTLHPIHEEYWIPVFEFIEEGIFGRNGQELTFNSGGQYNGHERAQDCPNHGQHVQYPVGLG